MINGTNNRVIANIPVGSSPTAIGVDTSLHTIYVANSDSDTVSVINGTTNTVIGKPIPVGKGPTAIGLDTSLHTIYVANSDSDTVSVINGTTKTITANIPVGAFPTAIGVNEVTGTVYVADTGDNAVSVVDSKANKVVSKVMFNIEPLNGGHIECDNRTVAPVGQQFYIYSGSRCTAKPEPGFEFDSWQQNLGRNSTQLINATTPPSIVDSILDFLHRSPDKPEAKLSLTKFGNFTANFKAIPPPDIYIVTLFTVVATALFGSWTFIGSTVIQRRKAKEQVSKLEYYHNEIKKVYNDSKLDGRDIDEYHSLSDSIKDEYARGNINKESYDRLRDEISIRYGEILTQEIDSLKSLSENDKIEQLSTIVGDIEEMHLEGKINNQYYTNLKKETSILYEEIFNQRINSLNGLSEKERAKLLVEIKDDISDTYSKEKISELHYNLLEKKLSNYEKPKT